MSQPASFSSSRLSLRSCASLLILATCLVAGAASAFTYTVLDLATLAPGATVVVRGPNEAGMAVGGGRVAGVRRGLVFANGDLQPVDGLAGSDHTTALGINDLGAVVGAANTADALRAFVSTRAGGTQELPPLPGDSASMAFALSNSGQAVGFSSGPGGERAVLWAPKGTVSALADASGAGSRALDINERGDVVGVTRTEAGPRATVWPTGRAAQDLSVLAGHVESAAAAVNARGDIAGYSAAATGARRATLWRPGGEILDLGTLPGGDFSQALGVNDVGHVVGTSTSNAGARAFIWTPTDGLRDLNNLITPSAFVLTQATGINTTGMIVAIGHDADPEAGSDGHEAHEQPVRVFLLIRSGELR